MKYPDGPNAVVELLKNHGFSDTQLSSLVKKLPKVLLAKPGKTLLPKLNFFLSIGVSTTDLPKILIGNTSFLTTSLEKNTIPRYNIIRSLVRSDKEAISTLKNGLWSFHIGSVRNDAVRNIEVLRQLGLPQGSISLLVTNFPSVAFTKHSRFVEAVKTVKEIGFDPLKTNFVLALEVVAKIDKATWKSKLKVFESWGWSSDICLSAFKRYPQYMLMSEKKILKIMSFLMKEGFAPEDIARSPGILIRSLEKTLAPRCAVVKILKSRGLVKSDLRISSYITINEKMFLERYVTRFKKDVPQLLDAFKGQKSG